VGEIVGESDATVRLAAGEGGDEGARLANEVGWPDDGEVLGLWPAKVGAIEFEQPFSIVKATAIIPTTLVVGPQDAREHLTE
jgi:hypothetical protein